MRPYILNRIAAPGDLLFALECRDRVPIFKPIEKQRSENSNVSHDPKELDDLQDDHVELSKSSRDSKFEDENQATAPGSQDMSADEQTLLAEIETLKNEVQESKEQFLRAQAEMHNIRRRAQQDVEKAHKFGLEKFVNDMLPVADNLERAIAAASEQSGSFEAITEGVELTLKSLLDALKRHQVERVDPLGEPFNPELHQAMTAIPNPDMEPNTVMDVFQRGYTLNGRLVRPAMVVVAKSPG